MSVFMFSAIGTTSACAENTDRLRAFELGGWNYLRVRGEYGVCHGGFVALWELPPRARRIPMGDAVFHSIFGTTSACAENTELILAQQSRWGNYLRVRGEYPFLCRIQQCRPELPPRARRIQYYTMPQQNPSGTTSACAENTRPGNWYDHGSRNYLRVRGEYSCIMPSVP